MILLTHSYHLSFKLMSTQLIIYFRTNSTKIGNYALGRFKTVYFLQIKHLYMVQKCSSKLNLMYLLLQV